MTSAKKLVLHIEREPIQRINMTHELEAIGVEIRTHSDMAAASNDLHDPALRLLISDVEVEGGLSHVQIVEVLKRVHAQIGLIVTSAASDALRRELPGNTVFLPKPYAWAQMVDSVRLLLA